MHAQLNVMDKLYTGLANPASLNGALEKAGATLQVKTVSKKISSYRTSGQVLNCSLNSLALPTYP